MCTAEEMRHQCHSVGAVRVNVKIINHFLVSKHGQSGINASIADVCWLASVDTLHGSRGLSTFVFEGSKTFKPNSLKIRDFKSPVCAFMFLSLLTASAQHRNIPLDFPFRWV